MRPSKYNAELLGPIVRASQSIGGVLRALGLPLTGGNYRMIAARIRAAGLDATHFGTRTFAKRVAAISPTHLETLVAESRSLAQVLLALQLPPDGRAHRELARRLRELGISTAHLRGQGWSRGETKATNDTVARIARRISTSDADVFVERSSYLSGRGVVRRLLAKGWRYECAWCGIATWRDQPLVLHLDHINGINNDHRLENLRLLCPNCHSQTPTYGSRARELDACYTFSRTRAWRNW